jgi:hypothetical protein
MFCVAVVHRRNRTWFAVTQFLICLRVTVLLLSVGIAKPDSEVYPFFLLPPLLCRGNCVEWLRAEGYSVKRCHFITAPLPTSPTSYGNSLCCQLAIREELKGLEEMRQVIFVQKREYDPLMNQWFLVLTVDSMFPIL